MKHQGYGKVVELPKVNGFMGRRKKEKGGQRETGKGWEEKEVAVKCLGTQGSISGLIVGIFILLYVSRSTLNFIRIKYNTFDAESRHS